MYMSVVLVQGFVYALCICTCCLVCTFFHVYMYVCKYTCTLCTVHMVLALTVLLYISYSRTKTCDSDERSGQLAQQGKQTCARQDTIVDNLHVCVPCTPPGNRFFFEDDCYIVLCYFSLSVVPCLALPCLS